MSARGACCFLRCFVVALEDSPVIEFVKAVVVVEELLAVVAGSIVELLEEKEMLRRVVIRHEEC
jgi:hypothetical protein